MQSAIVQCCSECDALGSIDLCVFLLKVCHQYHVPHVQRLFTIATQPPPITYSIATNLLTLNCVCVCVYMRVCVRVFVYELCENLFVYVFASAKLKHAHMNSLSLSALIISLYLSLAHSEIDPCTA